MRFESADPVRFEWRPESYQPAAFLRVLDSLILRRKHSDGGTPVIVACDSAARNFSTICTVWFLKPKNTIPRSSPKRPQLGRLRRHERPVADHRRCADCSVRLGDCSKHDSSNTVVLCTCLYSAIRCLSAPLCYIGRAICFPGGTARVPCDRHQPVNPAHCPMTNWHWRG